MRPRKCFPDENLLAAWHFSLLNNSATFPCFRSLPNARTHTHTHTLTHKKDAGPSSPARKHFRLRPTACASLQPLHTFVMNPNPESKFPGARKPSRPPRRPDRSDAPDDAKTMAKSALSSNISPSRRDSPTSVIAEMNQSCRQDEPE